jgi:hypothetical protein
MGCARICDWRRKEKVREGQVIDIYMTFIALDKVEEVIE